jgi:hypothetical protein
MYHRLDALQGLLPSFSVSNVALDKTGLSFLQVGFQVARKTLGVDLGIEVVENANGVTLLDEGIYQVGAYKAGSSCNENGRFHAKGPLRKACSGLF